MPRSKDFLLQILKIEGPEPLYKSREMTSDCSEVSRNGYEMSNASPVAERPSVVWSPVSSPNTPEIDMFSENFLMFSKQIKFSAGDQSITWRFFLVCNSNIY